MGRHEWGALHFSGEGQRGRNVAARTWRKSRSHEERLQDDVPLEGSHAGTRREWERIL